MVRLLALFSMLTGCGRLGFELFENGMQPDPDAAIDGAMIDGSPDAMPDAPPAGGPLTQQSQLFNSTGPATLMLPGPSTAGSLLVITMAVNSTGSLVLPTGFTVANQINVNGGGFALIAYQANNPGGLASVSYTMAAGAPSVAQLTEWSAIAFDTTGAATSSSPVMAQVVSSQATTVANDLAITVFNEDDTMPVYTPEPGWLSLGTASNTSALPSYAAHYKASLPMGVVTETANSSVAGKYAAVIATFRTQ